MFWGSFSDVVFMLMRIWPWILPCSVPFTWTYFHSTICREETEMTYLHRNQATFLWKQQSKATTVPRFWPYHQLQTISGSKLEDRRKAYLAANMIINLMKHFQGTKKFRLYSRKSRLLGSCYQPEQPELFASTNNILFELGTWNSVHFSLKKSLSSLQIQVNDLYS